MYVLLAETLPVGRAGRDAPAAPDPLRSPAYQEAIAALSGRPGMVRAVVTTPRGLQGLVDDPTTVVDLVLEALRRPGWCVGVGAGALDEPLPKDARDAAGPAMTMAEEAVRQARSRSRPVPLVVRGADRTRAQEAEAVLVALAALGARRSPEGWAAIDASRRAGVRRTQAEAARLLGVSQQAVSQRLSAAQWAAEVDARPVAARLLAEAQHSWRRLVLPVPPAPPSD